MDKRILKQLIFGFIFVSVIGVIVYGFIDYFFVTESTCFDKVQNGKEEGIDCGLLACGIACEPAIMPLNVLRHKFIEVRPGDYDFVAQVNNPNSSFGASQVRYELNITTKGASFQKAGTFFILPGQTRYVIIPSILSEGSPSDAILNITEVEWEKVGAFENINFTIQRKNYLVLNKNGTFSELEAVLKNNSDFDFDKVEAGVVLFSDSNDIVAVGRTNIRTFVSGTERYFKVSWPVRLPAVTKQDVEVLTNVFENSNFIKRYGTQEKFQKYY